jgi:2-(1,2-epoxy-1,2-dihydrophenyl)acetyl-CoA isomerase
LALLAQPVSAEAALEMGMVSAVVEPDELLAAALELAERFAAGPTQAYAAIKAEIALGATATLPEALAHEADRQRQLAQTADHAAATRAFVAKETTTFVGR